MYFGYNVCFASLLLFVPTITSEMGAFTAIQSNGLSAPPYLLCWLMTVLVAFVSEHPNIRGPFVADPALVAAVGYILLGTSIAVAVRYFAFFLLVQIFISVTLVLMWAGNTRNGLEERWSTGYIGDRRVVRTCPRDEHFPQGRHNVLPQGDIDFAQSFIL
jgi:hypothetical protein